MLNKKLSNNKALGALFQASGAEPLAIILDGSLILSLQFALRFCFAHSSDAGWI